MSNSLISMRSGDELIAGIDGISAQLTQSAETDDDAGRISQRSYDLLEAGGYTNMLAPREFGGRDLDSLTAMKVFERLSQIDMGAAWTAVVFNSQLKNLYFIERDAAEKLCAGGAPRIAGQGAPTGRAEKVDGGYRVTGRWSYASGLPFANFVVALAMVVQHGSPVATSDGAPDAILFFTPVETVTNEGNWDVLGLRATASCDYSMTDVFVPEEMACRDFFGAQYKWGGRSALLTVTGWLMWAHTSLELGLGRRILDELAEYARRPSPRRGRLSQCPVLNVDFAKAEAAFRSAHAWVYQVWEDIQATIDDERPLIRAQLTDTRAALLHIHDVNERNTSFAFRQAGGTSLRRGPLQRWCRDAMAAGQHLLLNTSGYVDCGRDYLGEAEGQRWSIYNLV